jgi:hypothetical protein
LGNGQARTAEERLVVEGFAAPPSTTWAETIWVPRNSNRIRNAVPPGSQVTSP